MADELLADILAVECASAITGQQPRGLGRHCTISKRSCDIAAYESRLQLHGQEVVRERESSFRLKRFRDMKRGE